MRKIVFFLCGIFVSVSSVFASVESFQIINFQWDETNKKLVPFAYGSGTAIQKNLILTNKHVVTNPKNEKIADFLLLCPAEEKVTRGVACNIPAGVVSTHPKFDAAMIRPLSKDVFLPYVRTAYYRKGVGDSIRLEGFPLPLGEYQNFGSSKTKENVLNWMNNGGTLQVGGDKLTVTRGNIVLEGVLKSTGGYYLFTDAKVNFGNSGGAAFDGFGSYIGIPTLKDKESNAIVLSYNQLRPWLAEIYNQPPKVSHEILDYYEEISKPAPTKQLNIKNSSSVPVQTTSRVPISVARQSAFRAATKKVSTSTQKEKETKVRGKYRPFSGGYYRRSRRN